MLSYIFLWRDDNGNNAYLHVQGASFSQACDMFHIETGREYFAAIEGCNMEMREFVA